MSGQNDFAERLKRIQDRQGGAAPDRPNSADSLPPLEAAVESSGGGGGTTDGPDGGGGGGGFGPIRMALILLVILGIFGTGALYIFNTFGNKPGEAVASDETETPVPAPETAQAPVEEVPAVLAFKVSDHLGYSQETYPKERGWRFGLGFVANAQRVDLALTDLVSGFDPARVDGPPREVVMFDPNPECTLRRPAGNEVVHNVRLESGIGQTKLHIVSDAALAKGVSEHITGITAANKPYLIGKTAKGNLGQVDVLVTDTSAPVYLVLQSMYGNTLWNVHRGPGVEIAHIAMIGNSSGLVSPNGVPFEALRISDFVDPAELEFKRMGPVNFTGDEDLANANETIRPCMIVPFRAPEPHWHAENAAREGSQLYTNQLHTFNTGHAAFADWYTRTLGTDPNDNLVTGEWAHHVLVGPAPASPLGYNPVGGRLVHLVRSDNVFLGEDALIEAHVALLTAATGGDPFSLDPAPMERATQ